MVWTPWISAGLLILLQGNWLAGAEAPIITRQPSDTYAVKHGIAELICEAKGTSLTYKWFHDGQRVQVTDRRRIHSDGRLYITRVVHKKKKGISDTGRYYCIVSNKDGQETKSKVVSLALGHIRKAFRLDPVSQTVSRGGELTLTCIGPRGRPKPKLRWLKDDRNVNVDRVRILLQDHSHKLVIKKFKKEDDGVYKCEATNVAGRKLSNPAVIRSTVAPKIASQPKSKTVDISIQTQVTFQCTAEGEPTPTIIWTKEGNNSILPNATNGTLILTNLRPRDAGKYTCTAYNTRGNVSATADLVLHYAPEFAAVSPDVNKREGSTLKLKCTANSEPTPSIHWRKGKEMYAPDNTYGHIESERRHRTVYLIFEPLKLSDAGNYTCEAWNKIKTTTRNVNVAVYRRTEFAPTISIKQEKISADINSNVTIICNVSGNPKPTVTWVKDGQDGDLGDGVVPTIEQMGKTRRYSLFISKVQQSNGGVFQCRASNKIKTVTEDIVLQVSRILHLSQPIKTGVPSMPKNVQIIRRDETSVTIMWDHSAGRVLVYAVGFINVDERSSEHYATRDVAPNLNKHVVVGLKPNTRYMFFVRGINKIGYGVPSLLSDVVRTSSATPTGAASVSPTTFKPPKLKISLRSAGAGELDVNWWTFEKGGKIDGYYIYWKVKGSKTDYQTETLQNDQASRYRITDLQNSTRYSVRVQVFKNAIKGPMSNVVHGKTSKEPVSLVMSVIQNDSDSMTVTWRRLWKKNSGKDSVKTYTIWFNQVGDSSERQDRRRKRNSQKEGNSVTLSASHQPHYIIGDLTPGAGYAVWMTVTTTLGRHYQSTKRSITLRTPVDSGERSKWDKVEKFILQPWFLGVIGAVVIIFFIILPVCCCVCRRSTPKKDVDNLSIQLQERNPPESVRKASEGPSTASDVLSPASRTRESLSECAESYDGRLSSVYRCSGSPRTPRSDFDSPNIAITPNKYERMYRTLEARGSENGNYSRQTRKYSDNDFDSPSRYSNRTRNPYSPAPRPSCLNIDARSDYDNAKPKCESTPEPAARTPTRSPYPGEAPPDYETAIAENSKHEDNDDEKPQRKKDPRDHYMDGMPYRHDRYGNPSSRQSSCSPGSECGSSVAGRRKGLKPLPRLTIASVNWADMLPPPPSHPPPSSVATRSPPPSPTGTSMCSETTYGRSHASSFLPRRSGSVVSADMASDLEKETADSVRSGKSKGKSENKLPFDLAGITSDIIMQWADSVTNTSGSEDESPCSSPDRRSGISSDGSFLTDTDFANAVKAAAECGGFNIDIDLNMYKAMDPISFQPFAGSLSTYNPETSSSIKPPSKKAVSASKDGDGLRDSSRGRRARSALETSRDAAGAANLPSVKEYSPYVSPNTSETKNNRKPRNVNPTPNNGSTGYVPALTRTSALGKLEPVNRGPVKKKYAVVRALPQVQAAEDTPDYTANYPSHSLSSSTSNASTIRSSSCPPAMLTDEETEDDVL